MPRNQPEHAVDISLGRSRVVPRLLKPGGRIIIIDKNAEAWGRLETPGWERWFGQRTPRICFTCIRHCREVSSKPISYWEDVEPDGLFLSWLADQIVPWYLVLGPISYQ